MCDSCAHAQCESFAFNDKSMARLCVYLGVVRLINIYSIRHRLTVSHQISLIMDYNPCFAAVIYSLVFEVSFAKGIFKYMWHYIN